MQKVKYQKILILSLLIIFITVSVIDIYNSQIQLIDLFQYIITTFVPLILLTSLYLQYLYNISKNISHSQKIDKKIDNLSNELDIIKSSIEILKSDTNELAELHKYSRLDKEISKLIDIEKKRIIRHKKVLNPELRKLLYKGVKEANYIFSKILKHEFIVDLQEIAEEVYLSFSNLKRNIDLDKLHIIQDTIKFIDDVENDVIKKNIDNFIICLDRIIQMNNGIRRENYKNLCTEMVINILNNTIDLYNEYTA